MMTFIMNTIKVMAIIKLSYQVNYSSLNSRGGHNPLHASKPTTHTQNHLNKTNTVIQEALYLFYLSDFECV
jgi:hypothetical protein